MIIFFQSTLVKTYYVPALFLNHIRMNTIYSSCQSYLNLQGKWRSWTGHQINENNLPMGLNARKTVISDEINRNRGGKDNIYFLSLGKQCCAHVQLWMDLPWDSDINQPTYRMTQWVTRVPSAPHLDKLIRKHGRTLLCQTMQALSYK